MKPSKVLRSLAASAFAIACLAGLVACSSATEAENAELADAVAATVNGAEIKEQTITDYIQDFREVQGLSEESAWGAWLAMYGYDPASIREQVIDFHVDEELVKQAAAENDVTVTDEEIQEQVDMMKANYGGDEEAWQNALTQAGTTEDQYRENLENAILEQRLEEAVSPEAEGPSDEELLEYAQAYAPAFDGARRSSHILFAEDEAEAAQELLDQINDGDITFEKAFDQYPHEGEDLPISQEVGWDMLNDFVTEYTDALSKLDEGEVSDLVTSQFGIHIIKCTEVYEAPDEITKLDQVPTEMVDYIKTMLESSGQSNAFAEWKADYKEKADIVVNDMPAGLPYDIDMTPYKTEEDAESTEAEGDADMVEVETGAEEGAESESAESGATAEESAEEDAAADEAAADADADADADEAAADADTSDSADATDEETKTDSADAKAS